MQQYKKDFIEFLVKAGALKFGDFTLKSGRKCPYFLNLGAFYRAAVAVKLYDYYAQALIESIKEDFDVIFGPAYKGIPLAVGVSAAYYFRAKRDVGYCFNRKEAKDHGDGGRMVGAPIDQNSKIVIVDDVMTAGTALKESINLLKQFGPPQLKGVVIAVDRMEKGQSDKSAVQELKNDFGVDVFSIVTLDEVMSHLHNREIDGQVLIDNEKMAQIKEYRSKFGV